MRRIALVLMFSILFGESKASGAPWAPGLFATKSHDFGTIAAGAKAEYKFVMTNSYAKEIHIASARSSCGCSNVRIENPTLQTYETGAVVASINSQRLRGRQSATITVVFDRPAYAEVQLQVKVFIRGDILLSPAGIEFGDVSSGKSAEKQLTVTRYGAPEWKLTEVACGNPHLHPSFEETTRTAKEVAYSLKVLLDEQAPDGVLNEAVLLSTTDGDEVRISVLVQGKILPRIAVAPQDLFLGAVAPGETVTRQIVVRSDEPFQIVAIDTDCDCFEFTLPEKPAAKTLHIVPVKFTAAGSERGFNRVIRIQTDEGLTAQLVAHVAVKPN